MKVLDLFSGAGGFSLGLERAGMETIAFCEIDPYARKVLQKHWPNIPIHKDVRQLNGKWYRGAVDVVCGGFPCQDLSQAGKQVGFEGERSSLYREMLRIIGECRPQFGIFENVTGLLTGEQGRWFAQFLYDLAEIGYDAEWHCISASYLGTPHHRDRIWIIAYANELTDGQQYSNEKERANSKRQISDVAYSNSDRLQGRPSTGESQRKNGKFFAGSEIARRINQARGTWAIEPDVGRVANGVPSRLDRIRCLGNAVVPQIPEVIGRAIMEIDND